MPSAIGMIKVVSNSELSEMERREAEARHKAEEANNQQPVQGLIKHVLDSWSEARTHKQKSVEKRLKAAQLARAGMYDAAKLSAIREMGASEEYARVTANKCRVIESWLRDVYLGQTQRPWTLKETPVPDTSADIRMEVAQEVARAVAQQFVATGQMPDPEVYREQAAGVQKLVAERVKEQAAESVRQMEELIADQLHDGGFNKALVDFLADLVTFPSAIMKGPVLRKKRTLSWQRSPAGATMPNVEEKVQLEFERVDPFRAYPAPGVATPDEGYFIEHISFTAGDLYELIGVPGFNEDAIRAVLQENSSGRLNDWLLNAAQKDSINHTTEQERRSTFGIDCLEFHGPIRGRDLLEWGMSSAEIDDPDRSYEACVWVIGRWAIKAQLNYHPLGFRPYYKTSYEEMPGEFWGFGVPDVLEDVQGVVNAAVRSLVNNMGMASGPQVMIDVERLAPGEEITSLRPWKQWQVVNSQAGATSSPIDFFQPNSNVNDLLAVIEKFYQFADDFSLVPRYMAGSDRVGGAARTASGLSMLMDAANKGLKGVVGNIDERVLSPLLERVYTHNMLYAKDDAIKSDAQVVARGAVSLMQLESLQLRRNEFLNVTANPVDMEIVGPVGRAEVLREVARGLELDTSRIVPPRQQLEAQLQAQQQQAAAAAAPQGTGLSASGEQLSNGAAVTDNFGPNNMQP